MLAVEKGIKIHAGEISIGMVKSFLKEGKFVILGLDTKAMYGSGRSVYHPLLTAYENNEFTVIDLHGERKVHEKKLNTAFDNIVKKRKRDHKMLILSKEK